MTAHRTLICTFTAIASGLLGAYAGNQLSAIAQRQVCEAQTSGITTPCKLRFATKTAWDSSFAGFSVGAILGVFVARLATQTTNRSHTTSTFIPTNLDEPELLRSPIVSSSPALELTGLQTEVLYCLLVLLAAQSDQSDAESTPTQSKNTAQYLPQFRVWAETMAQSQSPTYDVTKLPDAQDLTVNEARQLLISAGFSTQAVDQAWQILRAAGSTSST